MDCSLRHQPALSLPVSDPPLRPASSLHLLSSCARSDHPLNVLNCQTHISAPFRLTVPQKSSPLRSTALSSSDSFASQTHTPLRPMRPSTALSCQTYTGHLDLPQTLAPLGPPPSSDPRPLQATSLLRPTTAADHLPPSDPRPPRPPSSLRPTPLTWTPLRPRPPLRRPLPSDPHPPQTTSPVKPTPLTWTRLAEPICVCCTKGLGTGGGKKDA